MTGLKNVLALTDLSAPSRHAVARAALLAKESGAHLELLHVAEASAFEQLRVLLGEDAGAVTERLLDEARNALRQLASVACAPHGVGPGVHLATGAPLGEIQNRADACDADLIVLGARGAGFLRHALLGSTAERLLRKTARPLLVVRQFPHESYRRVLVAVDFSAWSLASIDFARTVAPRADLILFNAFDVPFEGKMRYAGVDEEKIHYYRNAARVQAERDLRALAKQAGLSSKDYLEVIVQGDAAQRILEQEQEYDIDLIVVGKHGKSMTEELLLGSTTKRVLAQTNSDVLVTHRGQPVA